MSLMDRIMAWLYASQRQMDIDVLWPTCCAAAPDLDHAKASFALHAMHDVAWQCLGQDAILEFIDKLECERWPSKQSPS